MSKQADLIDYLFEGRRTALSAELLAWMEDSSRFTAFVDTYRDKIRKKIRVTRDAESLLDLRGELEVACSLLNDRRLAVTYEPYASAKRRGPDFAVTYRANLVFNVEVARLRAEENGTDGTERSRSDERILRILLNKLGQMQPGMANLLLIHTRAELVRAIDLAGLLHALKTRAEGKDPAFYAASRYPGPAAFYKDFLHLSAILLWASTPAGEPAGAAGQPPARQLWANKQARPGLDEKVLRLVSSLPTQTPSPPTP